MRVRDLHAAWMAGVGVVTVGSTMLVGMYGPLLGGKRGRQGPRDPPPMPRMVLRDSGSA